MSQAFEQPQEQFPSYTDRLLFGTDWDERFGEHATIARAGMGAIRDIASDPELTTDESLARQAQALEIVCDSIKLSAGAAAIAILAKARTAEVFGIEYDAR